MTAAPFAARLAALALGTEPLADEEARAWAAPDAARTPALVEAAGARRERLFGRRVTYSPKVFLPITNLCRNHCDYCTFRRSPGQEGEHTMSPAEVRDVLDRGRAQGCTEALLCLGDTPETGFGAYRALLRSHGHERTVDYLAHAAELALERGLFAHTNAGILSRADMARLKPLNASMGLMLESVSPRLCAPGMPHHRAPDKRPHTRLRMTREAGELRIAFTSGLLVGIGETPEERVDTLLAIRDLALAHGHVQEVIVQGFRAKPDIPMAAASEPTDLELLHTVALARLLLPADVSVQAPPNLSPEAVEALVRAGVDDLGGISPVTPDFINPGHPWPHLDRLAEGLLARGFELAPRLPVHDRFAAREGFLEEPVRSALAAARGATRRALAPAPAGANVSSRYA